jgi:hypothetical protein
MRCVQRVPDSIGGIKENVYGVDISSGHGMSLSTAAIGRILASSDVERLAVHQLL